MCVNYRGISLVSHAGKVLLKVAARRRSAYCEAKGLLPEEQCGFRPDCSSMDMIYVVRRLQEIGWKAGVSLFMCFIGFQKACDTVHSTLLSEVLTRIRVPWKAGVSNLMCFIGFQKACDTIHSTLLSEVLTRIRVPSSQMMIVVIQ